MHIFNVKLSTHQTSTHSSQLYVKPDGKQVATQSHRVHEKVIACCYTRKQLRCCNHGETITALNRTAIVVDTSIPGTSDVTTNLNSHAAYYASVNCSCSKNEAVSLFLVDTLLTNVCSQSDLTWSYTNKKGKSNKTAIDLQM